uniref:Uncharacterized protein n=1 Tax=Ignisphaera aggregans TaxID=334771 RepID=A0A7J3JRG4_9CREN
MIFEVLLVAVIAISVYALLAKKFAGIPLVIGLFLLLAVYLVAAYRTPPTLTQIVAIFFLLGASVPLLAWGIANFISNLRVVKREITATAVSEFAVDGVKAFITLAKPQKATYGIMYGLIPWNVEGAELLFNFLNNEIWNKGLKVEHFQAEHAQIGQVHVAFILGILRPKTIVDRILY